MSTYFYNDVELPALPEWDKTTYPYACIANERAESNYTRLIVSSAPFIVEVRQAYGTDREFGVLLDNGVSAKCTDAINTGLTLPSSWGEVTKDFPYIYGNAIGEYVIKWSNTDVYTEDGSVFLAASDPVPVPDEPETILSWQKHDAYKPNTKWNGNTFYRVMGGQWVKQGGVVPTK